MIPGLAVVVFFAVQRLSELALNRINAARLLARGGVKVSEPWYPLVIALHLAWLGGLAWLAWSRPMPLWWIAVFAVLQAARMWTVTSLGERWTTEIIVTPGEARLRRGPYRWLAHPNYVVVALEVALVPLALGLTHRTRVCVLEYPAWLGCSPSCRASRCPRQVPRHQRGYLQDVVWNCRAWWRRVGHRR